ncbi:MAG: alanine racemase [Armatimonadetes bacterium]|nr:alanine racemase [Armatimonadota bacterium]
MIRETLRAWLEIDRAALRCNVQAIRSLIPPHTDIIAIVKADAYGHGAVQCCEALREADVSRFAVAALDEALKLREAFPDIRILILGGLIPEAAPYLVRHRLDAMISSRAMAEALSGEAVRQSRNACVHLKVDTGMGRIGIMPDEAAKFVQTLKHMPGLRLEGLATHFATSDCDLDYARIQLAAFRKVVESLKRVNCLPPLIHAANSAAVLALPDAHFTAVRPGLLVCGVPPYKGAAMPSGTRPVLAWKTRLSLVREMPAGRTISYGCTYRLERPSRVAVLPVGYADGFPRSLSSRGIVLVCGRRAPVLGRVCMDQCMVDVTDIPDTAPGDEAALLGRQGEAEITVNDLAEMAGTIHHEILSRLGRRMPRVYSDLSPNG